MRNFQIQYNKLYSQKLSFNVSYFIHKMKMAYFFCMKVANFHVKGAYFHVKLFLRDCLREQHTINFKL